MVRVRAKVTAGARVGARVRVRVGVSVWRRLAVMLRVRLGLLAGTLQPLAMPNPLSRLGSACSLGLLEQL